LGSSPAIILETGSSAWGVNSSLLFDSYVGNFGGEFWTVDNRILPVLQLRSRLNSRSKACCDDSVRFLARWAQPQFARQVNLVYLDSWDLNIHNPLLAANHGLQEFLAIRPSLVHGSILLVDDTPASIEYFQGADFFLARKFFDETGLVPGKGALINKILENDSRFEKIAHDYQVVFRYHESTK
jgi:hypothetical protein